MSFDCIPHAGFFFLCPYLLCSYLLCSYLLRSYNLLRRVLLELRLAHREFENPLIKRRFLIVTINHFLKLRLHVLDLLLRC